jgi:hypothetical protein
MSGAPVAAKFGGFYLHLPWDGPDPGAPPPVPLPLRPALRALAAQSAGLLPPALREYGLRWTRADGLALRASSQSCRRCRQRCGGRSTCRCGC